MLKPKVFISAPMDQRLTPDQLELKLAIIQAMEAEGFEPQEFLERGTPISTSWSFERANTLMTQCRGALILGFSRWEWSVPPGNTMGMASEYSHFEGALAVAHKIPMLILAEYGISSRGILYDGGGHVITYIPDKATSKWLEDGTFKKRFRSWCAEVKSFADKDNNMNKQGTTLIIHGQDEMNRFKLKNFLENKLGLPEPIVMAEQMRPGETLPEKFERLASSVGFAVALMTPDDEGKAKSDTEYKDRCRQNVITEIGWFWGKLGRAHIMLLVKDKVELPSDLQGVEYYTFQSSVEEVSEKIRDFYRAHGVPVR